MIPDVARLEKLDPRQGGVSWKLALRFDGTDLLAADNRIIVWEGEISERHGHLIAMIINAAYGVTDDARQG